ncbi:transmembrane protein 79-like [Saccoglossus kowalevskii]|uniref:Transmembrane protein 79-like n=1 Tax=Saccoglossus kowalevskii TaxID=10224 RepID=A0ABM0MX98_SACKO|nr:PREDICTED: transmembrane protein 79-like [Saccoglossus kowalevskii]
MASRSEDRLEVVRNTVAGGLVVGGTIAIGYFIIPIPMPSLPTVTDRLIFALRCQIFNAVLLYAGIQVISLKRLFTQAMDPVSGRGQHHVEVHCRYAQNTLESLVLSTFANLVISTYIEETSMKIIPILVFLFVVGRITFWMGYLQHPIGRAFGMGVTMFGTWLSLYYAVFCVVWSGLGFRLPIDGQIVE